MLPGVAEGMALLAKLPAQLIVVSNQAGIALGMYRREQMSSFNLALRERLEQLGGRIDAFYYCPELEPKHGGKQTSGVGCAKPSPAMLLDAARDYAVDLPQSYMVGDKKSDVAAGAVAGCKTILIGPGKPDEDFPNAPAPTFAVADFLQAAGVLLLDFHA